MDDVLVFTEGKTNKSPNANHANRESSSGGGWVTSFRHTQSDVKITMTIKLVNNRSSLVALYQILLQVVYKY